MRTCLCFCDLKAVRQNAKEGRGAPTVLQRGRGPEIQLPGQRGRSLTSWGRAGAAEGRGRRRSPSRGPAPSGSASGPAPPSPSRFSWRVPRPVLPRAIRLLEGVRSRPQRLVGRGGPGSAYLAVSGCALSLSLPRPPFHSSVISAAATAQVKNRLLRTKV